MEAPVSCSTENRSECESVTIANRKCCNTDLVEPLWTSHQLKRSLLGISQEVVSVESSVGSNRR